MLTIFLLENARFTLQCLSRKPVIRNRAGNNRVLLIMPKDLYNTIFDNNPDAILVIKPDGGILAANPAACLLFGLPEEVLQQIKLAELVSPGSTLSGNAPGSLVWNELHRTKAIFVKKDGCPFRALVSSAVQESPGQELKIVLFIRDVTNGLDLPQELHAGEDLLHQLASVLRVAVWIRDAQTRQVLYVNPAFEEIFGRPRQAFYDDPETVINAMPPEDRKLLTPGDTGISIEHRIIRPDGSVRWVWGRNFPVRNESGEIIRTASIMEDITDRKLTDEKLSFVYGEMQRQMDEIKGLHSTLQEQAIRDPLTGLYNRRYLDEALESEINHARRDGSVISLIMIDIDNFKETNDIYGHHGGDEVLRRLARFLRDHTRASDVACRFAGDEFVILLPDTPAETACQRADALRSAFLSEKTIYSDMKIHSTISIGVAQYPVHGATSRELLTAVDNAMYDAKAMGKNCVVVEGSRRDQ